MQRFHSPPTGCPDCLWLLLVASEQISSVSAHNCGHHLERGGNRHGCPSQSQAVAQTPGWSSHPWELWNFSSTKAPITRSAASSDLGKIVTPRWQQAVPLGQPQQHVCPSLPMQSTLLCHFPWKHEPAFFPQDLVIS